MKTLFLQLCCYVLLASLLQACKKDIPIKPNPPEEENQPEYLIRSLHSEVFGGGMDNSGTMYYAYDEQNRLIGTGADTANIVIGYTYTNNQVSIRKDVGTVFEELTTGILNEWGSFLYSESGRVSDTFKTYSYYMYDNNGMLLQRINANKNGSDTTRYEIVDGNVVSYTASQSRDAMVYKTTNHFYPNTRGQYRKPEDKLYQGKPSVNHIESISREILSPHPQQLDGQEYTNSFDANGNVIGLQYSEGSIFIRVGYTHIYQ